MTGYFWLPKYNSVPLNPGRLDSRAKCLSIGRTCPQLLWFSSHHRCIDCQRNTRITSKPFSVTMMVGIAWKPWVRVIRFSLSASDSNAACNCSADGVEYFDVQLRLGAIHDLTTMYALNALCWPAKWRIENQQLRAAQLAQLFWATGASSWRLASSVDGIKWGWMIPFMPCIGYTDHGNGVTSNIYVSKNLIYILIVPMRWPMILVEMSLLTIFKTNNKAQFYYFYVNLMFFIKIINDFFLFKRILLPFC